MALTARARDTEETLLEANLTVAVACLARGRAGTFLGAAAGALHTGFMTWNFNLAGCAERRFFEREIQIVSQIGAALDAAAPAPAAAEGIAKTENVARMSLKSAKTLGSKPPPPAAPAKPACPNRS
jgi:hypothetical protein